MKVAIVLPTHFDETSVIAGAERFAYELAKAMSTLADTTLVTFGDRDESRREGALEIRICKKKFDWDSNINPVSLQHLRIIGAADAIHCLQFRTFVTETAILWGALRGKRVFVTDLQGNVAANLSRFLPVWRGITAFLPISEFNRSTGAGAPVPRPAQIIYGGVDAEKFLPEPGLKAQTLLCVGRIFEAKGVHDLLDALPPRTHLDVIGKCSDKEYLDRLHRLGAGKNVAFNHDAPDSALLLAYQRAMITIIPTLVDGGFTTAMESMACGTPVIATKVGSLPEVIDDGDTGFLVPPRDPAAMREKIELLQNDPKQAAEMGRRGRETVLKKFTWEAVAKRCLKAYSGDK